jgi:adenosylhomocysteine nucleosidase
MVMPVERVAGHAKVLVVAALGRELEVLAARPNPDLSLLETGEGTANATRAISEALSRLKPRAVVAIGFAGALSEALVAGDLVVVSRVAGVASTANSKLLPERAQAVRLEGIRIGTAITVDAVVCDAARKRRLAVSLEPGEIGVVDMESSAVARECNEHRVPFLIVRAVTDLLNENLPVDFNRCRGADGRVSSVRVVLESISKPGSLRGLRELNRRAKLCSARLADFVERFSLLLD